MKSARCTTGFTLIELLVVVAIIGVLAGVVLSSLNSARSKARDTFRAQSIVGIGKALELYYNDHGAYPSTGGSGGEEVLGAMVGILQVDLLAIFPILHLLICQFFLLSQNRLLVTSALFIVQMVSTIF